MGNRASVTSSVEFVEFEHEGVSHWKLTLTIEQGGQTRKLMQILPDEEYTYDQCCAIGNDVAERLAYHQNQVIAVIDLIERDGWFKPFCPDN